MRSNRFAGLYLFSKDPAGPGKLLRAAMRAAGRNDPAKKISAAPGLALPPGNRSLPLAGKSGSWLQFESPHAEAGEAAGLYLEQGKSFPSALRGQFAFALYEAKDDSLLLGTDRFSELPVFYALFRGGLAWSDYPGLLSRLPGVDGGTDPRAVDLYLSMRYVPPPFTMYKGVRKLPPSSVLTLREGKLSISSYWTPPVKVEKFNSSGEAAEAVRAALADAVRHRLGGEKKAAGVVSGGLDSSAVSAMLKYCGAGLSTFTLSSKGKEWDFFGPGKALAKAVGSDHHEILYGGPRGEELLEMAAGYGEPQADQCAYPLWKAAGLMKGKAGLMFSGDGGDEVFAGYGYIRKMLAMAREQRAPELELLLAKARLPETRLTPALRRSFLRGAERRLRTVYYELSRIYFADTGDFFLEKERRALCLPGFTASLGAGHVTAAELVEKELKGAAGQDWLNRLTLPDLLFFHPDCTVPRLRATAARAGMRMVFPFLDHKLVELVRGLPENLKLPPGGGCKFMLRKAMEPLLPGRIRAGAQRCFSVPAGTWLKGSLKNFFRDTMLAPGARTAGLFKRKAVEKLFSEHLAGAEDRTDRLWNLFMLELWLRTR